MVYPSETQVRRQWSTLQEEKEDIKKAIRSELREHAIWHAISAFWFIKWKSYVDFDDVMPEYRDKELLESLYPGEVDNNHLKGYGDELKKGLIEGRDYILIPGRQAEDLLVKYKGGPSFSRAVVNVGTYYAPILQVRLWPTRVCCYYCDSTTPEPVQSKTHFVINYLNENSTIMYAGEFFSNKFRLIPLSYPKRYWIREDRPEQLVSSSKRERPGRMLTSEAVDFDGEWRYVRGSAKRSLQDLLGERDHVAMIVEVALNTLPKEADWPRYNKLEGWKDSLLPGDVIDCRDTTFKWFEAVVKSVDSDGNVSVHYKGWESTEFDEIVPKHAVHSRIEPLYTKTTDRSTWEEGDQIDICYSEEGASPRCWCVGTITQVNVLEELIQVKYDLKDTVINDDDLLKKKIDYTSTKSAATSSTGTDSEGSVREWCDLYGERVSQLHSHTAVPKKTVTNSYDTSYSYSGTYKSYTDKAYDYERNSRGAPLAMGVCGLQNLGNTCFMNSILQCLSNTQVLTELFISGRYKDQINYDNALGHGGKVALVYGKLIKDMWSNAYTKVVPREFKQTIGEFQPQFAGYDQQDSQELMGFLLDGLNEDLNRVAKKPYVPHVESKGRDDALIASEAWRRFLLRNDSELVERFYGQLKSHVTCMSCGNESVTFDAFLTLSLPIPVKNTRTVSVLTQLLPRTRPPVKISIEVEITQPMSQLKRLLVERLVEVGILERSLESEKAEESSLTDGYEMIDHHDAMDTSEDLPAAPAPAPASASAHSRTQKKDKHYSEDFHFHFGTAFGMRATSVFKNYCASEAEGAAIQSFIGRSDALFAFQLELPVPDFKSSSYYYYDKKEHTNKRVEPSSATASAAASQCFGVDLCMATKFHERIELVGFPQRLSFPKGVTSAEVQRTVKRVADRFIRDKSYANAYDLVVTSSYGTAVKRRIDHSETPMEAVSELLEMLVILWTPSAIKDNAINTDAFKTVDDGDRERDDSHSLSVADKADAPDEDVTDMYSNNTSTHSNYSTPAKKQKPDKRISIYDCFDKFIEREHLAERETLYCSSCKQHLAPVKKMDLWAAPDILIIHLKRFQFIPGQFFVHREKIGDLIDFPIEGLDLRAYAIGPLDEAAPPVYDLYAVSHHMGGLGGGHYTASCKNFMNNKWYYFNDSVVTETSAESAVNSSAYVLFYKRRYTDF